MKYEWRKKDKTIYLPKEIPTLIDVPEFHYLTLTGRGNPNDDSFSEGVEALYAMSYGIRMAPKKGLELKDYYEYTVFPLEGSWNLDKEGIRLYNKGTPITQLKQNLTYKLMIRQPDFVTPDIVETIQTLTKKKKNNPRINDVTFESIQEGLCLQMLHKGSYDSEPATFQLMEEYCKTNNLKRTSKEHKEIYLSDPRKTEENNLKTTLRFHIKRG